MEIVASMITDLLNAINCPFRRAYYPELIFITGKNY